MARTPLFRLLQRTLREARRNAAGLPSAEEMHHGIVGGATRREFLRRSGVVLVGAGVAPGLLLAGCRGGGTGQGGTGGAPPRRPGSNDPGVVIVGAGIAGLTAGWRLHQAGLPVHILEAQDRIGGRMYSIRDHFADGQVAELGGELIDSGHQALRGLAAELEIELDDLHEIETAESELWHFGGAPRSEAEIVAAWGPAAARIQADLAALRLPDEWPWVTWDAPAGAESLDRMSLAEWLSATELDSWFRALLDTGFTSQYGREAGEQSALNLHTMIDPTPDHFHIYGESDERFHVQGGNDRIPRALAERLEPVIDRGTRLDAVRLTPAGRYELSVDRGGTAGTLHADHLILALPFTLLRRVDLDLELPAVKRRAIAELGYGTNAKLMMGFQQRSWRTQHGHAGTVITDRPFQVTWETSRGQAGAAGILTNFTGGDAGLRLGEGSAADRAREVTGSLEGLFPGIEAAHDASRAVRFHWPTHPWTEGSYACYLPGQWTGLAGAEGMPVGRLHFAGEHTSLDAQGYMEGGCESGERAAAEVLAALGVRSAA
jgi:monoamine oxidase